MADPKTKRNRKSVKKFLNSVDNERRRDDAYAICDVMEKLTKCKPEMWGDSIVGFGTYRYVYESGREGDWMLVAFSPRKSNLTLYIMTGFSKFEELLSQLGKHKKSKACLYINKLEDIDMKILKKIIRESIKAVKKKYGSYK